MFRKLVSAGLVAAVAAVWPALAGASNHEPFGFGEASRGSLRVISGIFVTASHADLRGVWLDESQPCTQFRALRVSVLIDYSRRQSARPRTVTRRRTGAVQNCAEGGPNFGFTLGARRHNLACPNGRWRPGFYTFQVRTRHLASGLLAIGTVGWNNRQRC